MSLQLLRSLFRQSYVRPTYLITRTANYSDAKKIDDPDQPISMENPFKREEKKCILCQMNIFPEYKNVRLLSQFQSPYTGYIYGRHITGLCKTKQEIVEREIKKAKTAGIMATYLKSPEFLADPRLFDPERPIRPHKY